MEMSAETTDVQTSPTSYDSQLVCGFWRRIFALVIDSAILGIVGLAIGSAFYDFFAGLGFWGLAFGFVIALAYFGIGNSSLASGQTIGKRVMKLKVVDSAQRTVSPLRASLRFCVLGIPFFLNGAPVPPAILANPIISFLLGLLVFFGGGSIVYLYLFNRRTRQSLHDILADTFVINAPPPRNGTFPAVWKGHYAVVGGILIAVTGVITVVVPKLGKTELFSDMATLQRRIQESGLVHTSTVNVGKNTLVTSNTGKTETTFLSTTAILKRRPADYDRIARSLASIVLQSYPKAKDKDIIIVNVTYGYDIGIASAWSKRREQHTPKEWGDLLASHSSTKTI